MLRFNVTNSESGFTLIEQLVVLLLVGILGAFIAPNMMGMNQRNELNEAVSSLRSSLQEVQRQAIMKSTNCTVTLPVSNTSAPTLTSSCFVLGSPNLSKVKIIHNYASNSLQFDYQGKSAVAGLIRLEHSKKASLGQKCIQISQPLGLIRVGDYDGTNCKAVQ
jgi:prepilin-type N-terminal cleavage/methylation domain-containing protein